MKHVFIINSHTTFLTSMGTIDYKKIKNEDIIFLFMRNYKNTVTPIHSKIVDVSNLFLHIQKNWTSNKTANSFLISQVDTFIDSEIKENYHFYTPHLWAVFFQLIYTNKKCKSVSYIQEGAICQQKVFVTNNSLANKFFTFYSLFVKKNRTFDSMWYVSGCIYKQFSLHSYAIDNQYFKKLPSKKHIIQWPKQTIQKRFDEKAPIFIFDGFVGNKTAEEDIYLQNCRHLIQIYSKQFNYLKFHPEQSKEERKKILNFFEEHNSKYDIIDDTVPMEYIIMSTKNMTYIGFGSSLLHYAIRQGHKVICHDDWLMKESPLYQEYHNRCGLPLFHEVHK